MRAPSLLALACALACGPLACGGGGASTSNGDAFPAQPFATIASDAGKLRVELRSTPDQPPPRGVDTIELRAFDPASGAPVDGLSVDALPWMPAMGHGASVKPTVSANGGGRYVVSDCDFYMPGQWELRLTFTGPVEDHATATIPIR